MVTVEQSAFSTLFLCNTISLVTGIYNYQASHQVKYEGCMKKGDLSTDFQYPASLKKAVKDKNLDIFICVRTCWLERNRVAALQKGTECYCARSAINAVRVPEGECNRRCKGNCYQTCGGEHVMSVYQTGYIAEKPFEIDKNALLSAKIGCYDSASSKSVLCDDRFAPLKTARMTVAMCVSYCDSVHHALFATLSSTDSCCCSTSVSRAKNTNLEWCNIPCSGSVSMGCVGNFLGEQWATFQLSRLPSFKRWPKDTFTMADWLEPIFPAGETFTNPKEKLVRESDDSSLSGLIARKMARQPGDQDWKSDGMVGQDKREPEHEGVENSVAVFDAPNKQDITEDNSNGIIIGAVVTGFAIFTIAFGVYIFRRRSIVEESSANTNMNRKLKKKRRKRRYRDDDSDDETNLV